MIYFFQILQNKKILRYGFLKDFGPRVGVEKTHKIFDLKVQSECEVSSP